MRLQSMGAPPCQCRAIGQTSILVPASWLAHGVGCCDACAHRPSLTGRVLRLRFRNSLHHSQQHIFLLLHAGAKDNIGPVPSTQCKCGLDLSENGHSVLKAGDNHSLERTQIPLHFLCRFVSNLQNPQPVGSRYEVGAYQTISRSV